MLDICSMSAAADSSMSAAEASAEAASMFMSKFGNLSVGGGGETDTGVEAGSGSGEADDVFKSMDAACKVCMQEIKVRHQVLIKLVGNLACKQVPQGNCGTERHWTVGIPRFAHSGLIVYGDTYFSTTGDTCVVPTHKDH
jgi:hypothetical protein